MRRSTARVLLGVSVVVLIGCMAALALWPRTEPRADLVLSTPDIPTTTTAPPMTTTAPVALVPETTVAPPPPTTAPPPPPLAPGQVRIPSIGVDSGVVPVGLNPDGSMEVPGVSEVGWYELGVRPGSPTGSAVLAAHVDYGGQEGVFFNLRSLAEGAEIVVGGENGEQLRYVVSTRWQVDKDALPVQELFRSDGEEVLTLITCGGSFDRSARSYDDNIVVQARRVA